MKKTLIALAAVAVSSAAMAQVTISGAWGVGYQKTEIAGAADKKGFVMTDSDINFTVSEDLGNGMRASGSVSIAANGGRGGNVTKNDSSLALATGFGTFSVANTRSSNVAIASNVFGSSMPVVSIYASTDSRAAGDAATYTTPELVKGLRLSVTQFESTEGDVTAEKVNIIGASYANGPLMVTVANKDYSDVLNAAGAEDRTEGAITYDLGVAKVGLGYGTKTTATGKAGTYYGVSIPMGAITIGANGGKRGDAKYYDAGVKYSLSKRSTVNVMYGSRNTGTAGAADLAQYRVGLYHTF
jgi:predicted porin